MNPIAFQKTLPLQDFQQVQRELIAQPQWQPGRQWRVPTFKGSLERMAKLEKD